MIWLISALGFLLASGTPAANPTRVWLVVGASDRGAAAIAAKARGLAQRFPGGLVFATADCGEKANVFGFAADVAADPSVAETALARVRSSLPEAYLKRCDVKPQSLLAYRVHAVDPSIAGVPSNAVNWGDEDRISTISRLSDGRALAAVRIFENASEDPLEGRRTRLELLTGGSRLVLTESCVMPAGSSGRRGLVAVQCVVEQAADNLLHDVMVFGAAGQHLLTVSRCREPRWSSDTTIQCKEESVDADGVLSLKRKRVEVPSAL